MLGFGLASHPATLGLARRPSFHHKHCLRSLLLDRRCWWVPFHRKVLCKEDFAEDVLVMVMIVVVVVIGEEIMMEVVDEDYLTKMVEVDWSMNARSTSERTISKTAIIDLERYPFDCLGYMVQGWLDVVDFPFNSAYSGREAWLFIVVSGLHQNVDVALIPINAGSGKDEQRRLDLVLVPWALKTFK